MSDMARKPEPKPAPIVKVTANDEDPYHGLTEEMRDKWDFESSDGEQTAAGKGTSSVPKSSDDWTPRQPTSNEFAAMTGNDVPMERPPQGTLVQTGESFLPLAALSKFPYKMIKNRQLGQQIAEAFFDQGKFSRIHWDVCYAWPPKAMWSEPLLLVSKYQVECLIASINKVVNNACPTITSIDAYHKIIITFNDTHPDLRPRYLGYTRSQEDLLELKRRAPNYSYRPSTERRDVDSPTREARNAYITLLANGADMSRAKSKKSKAVREDNAFHVQRNWKQDLKHAERFLGLRPPHIEESDVAGEDWAASLARGAAREENSHPPPVDPTQPSPYPFDATPVLISIDVESYERDPRKITEVGISTLDTLDLAGIAPDEFGSAWRHKIRSRHFRVVEHSHLNNGEFVVGAANDFRFGQSEFIRLHEAPEIIATCFRTPFSAPKSNEAHYDNGNTTAEKRKIVLVGHGFSNDIRYMRNLGYDVKNLSNLSSQSPVLDTQGLYRLVTGEKDPSKLSRILADVDIVPFGLHNAGNDARYTMEALLGLVVKRASERTAKAPSTEA